MKTLDRDQILQADTKRQIEPVEVPEWGGTVYVRAMTAGERDRFEAEMQGKKFTDVRAKLAVMTVCDTEGNLLFSWSDVQALTNKSASAMSRVFNAAAKLNHLLPGDVEELEKNSKNGQSE